MIPTLLVVGLLVGLAVAGRWVVLFAGIGAISLAWAIGMEINDEGQSSLVVGSFLVASANLAVGALIGVGLRRLGARIQRPARNAGQDSS